MSEQPQVVPKNPKKTSEQRKADLLAKSKKRHVAFLLSYVGTSYEGFASNDDSTKTVEGHLLHVLKKTCLIEDREKNKYTRCARTDKGVHAAGQVISVYVRSNIGDVEDTSSGGGGGAAAAAIEAPAVSIEEDEQKELPYIKMLNSSLPPDIRIHRWSPVPADFDSRFSCIGRTYKYFFILRDLNLEAMREAASYLVGEHDFRNFCKMDKSRPNLTYARNIRSFSIEPISMQSFDAKKGGGAAAVTESLSPLSMFCFHIHASAFLWHQVRAMAAILFQVGEGKISATRVKELLDITQVTTKPNYQIASEHPLLLVSCLFPPNTFSWREGEREVDLSRLNNQILMLLAQEMCLTAVKKTIYFEFAMWKEREEEENEKAIQVIKDGGGKRLRGGLADDGEDEDGDGNERERKQSRNGAALEDDE